MYLMYVDESGDNGLPADGSPTRYFCLSGVVVHELRWQAVLSELLDFRRWLNRRYSIRLSDELHHAEMVGKTKNLAASLMTLPKHKRLEVIPLHVNVLSGIPDISIVNVVVDKSSGKLTDKELVLRGAWYRLFQRFENTIQRQNFPGPKNPSERGMVFPDGTDSERLRRYLNRMRARNPIKVVGESGSFNFYDRPITSLIEDPITRDSHSSYLIQAADLCVFLLKQFIEPSGFIRKHGANSYFKRLQPILCRWASQTDPWGIVRL